MRSRPRVTRPALLALALVACHAAGDDGTEPEAQVPAGLATEDEEVTSTREERFEETGARVLRAKVVDRARGELHDRTIDPVTGAHVDYDALRDAEMSARRTRFGAFVPAFAEQVARASSEASITADVLAVVGGPRDTALERELRAADAKVLRVDGALAAVEATPEVLRQLSRDGRFASIDAHVGSVATSLAAARDLGEVPLQWPHLLGVGAGIKVAVVEPNVCVRRTHEDFQFLTFEPRAFPCDIPSGAHSTAVLGALAAIRLIDGQWQGAGVFRAHVVESDVTSGALAKDPELFNMSATHSVSEVRGLDEAVWTKRTMIFAGSANSDTPGLTGATCHAYNLTCVGGYGTSSTPEIFTDDVHASGARWENPVSGREEPDLVGPMGVTTAGWESDDRYATWGGTSFATPAVTGLAGLLVAKYRAQLGRQPTLMRALLATSAIVHPIYDGDSTRIPIIGDGVDDKSGAGAPNGKKASDIVEAGTYHAAHVERGTHFDANGKYASTFSVTAAQGERVRVSLTWDNCPVNPSTFPNQDALIVDLDLAVRGPNVPIFVQPYPPILGTRASVLAKPRIIRPSAPFFASNASHVDNYETVEFVAPVAGNYVIEVTAPRWGVCPYDQSMATNLALAWTKQ